MRQRDERAVAVELELAHDVVGHAAVDRHRGEIPAARVFLARIDHHHVVIEHARHLGEIARELPGADQDQAPARPVHGREHAAVELEHVLPAPRLERGAAAVHFEAALHELLRLDLRQQLAKAAFVRDRLEHELERATARQAPARRLFVGHAVSNQFWFLGGGEFLLHLLDEIVLDAAAGHGADDLAVVADRHHGADRTRCRAPGLDDRAKRRAMAILAPVLGGTQHFDIDAIHGEMLSQRDNPWPPLHR